MKQVKLMILGLLLIACGKKDSPKVLPVIPPLPVAAILSFPIQNEECTTGTVVSASQSTIPFSWKSAENAESYEIYIKNLETGISISQPTTQTNLDVTLNRNTPYSWYIISKTSKSASTKNSDVWKFYNSGPGVTSHAPFPAETVAPSLGQAVTAVAGKVTLDWSSSDVDQDIANHDLYLGITPNPQLIKEKVVESIWTEAVVQTNSTYYWKVVSRDSKGNISVSPISQFKVN